MKKRITLMTAVFALFAILALPTGMKGQTRGSETITFADLGLENGIQYTEPFGTNINVVFAGGANDGKYYTTGSGIRTYGNGTITITALDNTVTAIATTFSDNNYAPTSGDVWTSNGTGTGTSGVSASWSGSATEVVLTRPSGNGHWRLQAITVTYTTSGDTPQPSTYTVTYDCNGGTSGCPEDATGIEAGTTISLAAAPSRDGFNFAGWNAGSTTYEAGDEYTVNGNVTFTAQWTEIVSDDEQWVLTSLADLTENDVFVIVGNNGSTYAMSNDKGTGSAPVAVTVTVEGNTITSTVASNIKWNVSGDATDGYTFYPNGSSETWLYCFNNNNGVRVGTGDDKTFVINSNYIYNSGQSRYIGIYNSADWRSYTSINNNIKDQTFAFYKKVTGEVIPPSITAENVSIGYDAVSGAIEYTINNEPTPAGNLSATTTANWLTIGTVGETVPFTCSANTEGTARTATVTLTYTYGANETVTKDVTVTQAAAPVTYTTIPALFEAATSTATEVTVTFGGWVVSAVKGSNAYLTDNQGNGLIIYASDHGFQVNDVLTGTAGCKLQLYRRSAELTELTTSTEGLSVADNGTVTEQNIAISELGGVNTGSLLAYEGLTYNGTALVDSDNNTITPYSTLYSYSFEEGHTYNVKGIYLQYNSTKELLPRSADDIEEVEVPTDEYTLTVTISENIEIFTFVEDLTESVEGATTLQVNNGTEVGLSVSATEGYVLTLVVDGTDVTALLDETGYYTFNMPAHDVTVTANATLAPIGTTSTYTLATSIESGKQYIIVGQANGDYYAMGNDKGNNRYAYEITLDGTTATATISSAGVHEFTISSLGEGFYSICDAIEPGYLYAASSNSNQLKTEATLDENHNGDWEITFNAEGGSANVVASQSSNRNVMQFNNSSILFACYATASQHPVFLYVKEDAAPETYTLEIKGYEAGSDGGYYLIASPVSVDPATVVGMTDGNYDLYYFDAAEEDEWQNYKQGGFNLEPGKGYLYAKQATTEGEVFQFELSGTPYNNQPIILNKTEGGDFPSWNLVGNPFGETAYVDRDFYVMKEDGSEIIEGEGNAIEKMQGFFVIATEEDEELNITTEAPANTGSKITVNVSQNRGNVIDRAAIRVDNGRNMPKFMLNPNNTKLYIPQNGEQFAVVRSERAGRLPIVFKPSEDGEYTFSINTENLNMLYLHLIDHETGRDIDLLRNPSYRFFAKTNNKPNRFELEYKSGLKQFKEKPMAFKDNFGYYSNGEIVINGTGDLQVFDLNGRLIKRETVNGDARIQVNATAGIYMMQLITNDSIMTQKVVVK